MNQKQVILNPLQLDPIQDNDARNDTKNGKVIATVTDILAETLWDMLCQPKKTVAANIKGEFKRI